MKYKLLVLDIDGTSTNSKNEVTPRTLEAIIRLQEMGIPVALASGRPTPGVSPIADIFQFDKYGSFILSYNGAKIINWKTKECVYSKTLPLHIPAQVYEEACKYDLGVYTLSPDESTIICGRQVDEYVMVESTNCKIPIQTCNGDFVERVQFPTTKCMLTAHPDYLERIEPLVAERFRDEANVFRSEGFFLEIMPQKVDKAYCLSRLLEILGISREEMVCVGDGFNDCSMIKFAGLGVAMANAKDAVKECADYITCSNDEDGVVHVIEKFFFDQA